MVLEQKFYQIRDALMRVRVSLLEGTANEFDFYRYLPKRDKELPENIRDQIRKKFRAVFKLFMQRVKSNSSNEVKTLNKIQDMLTMRTFKIYELNDFKIDADITPDYQGLIENIIKTRTENFIDFQKKNPKLFIEYYKKKALRSGANMNQTVPGISLENGYMLNHSQLGDPNATIGSGGNNNLQVHNFKASREVTEAKMRLAETHEIPNEWEDNIEKVTNLLEYQNAKISGMIEEFKDEQDEIEQEIQNVMSKFDAT